MATFGLLGKNIQYSFSKGFFTEKFKKEKLPHQYVNFDVDHIEDICTLIEETQNLKGFNVTIPYKEEILPYLAEIDPEAEKIGAVNTIKIRKNGNLVGYNTDHYGFALALQEFLPIEKKTALILGSGGASKAIKYVLETLQFEFQTVSRTSNDETLTYEDISERIINDHSLIINCTPLGTHPNIDQCPKIPYQFLTKEHLLFDLVYNPRLTEFMKRGFTQGAAVTNGLKMLEQQALKAWSIWNS